jgi:hypothetical protein
MGSIIYLIHKLSVNIFASDLVVSPLNLLGILIAVIFSFHKAIVNRVETSQESIHQLNHIIAFSHPFCFQNSFIT